MNRIDSERLIFRNYKNDEIEKFIGLVTDEKIMKYVGNGVFGREDAEKLWNKLFKDFYLQGINTIWAVFEKEDLHYIGHCAIRQRPTKKEDWEISYMLREESWGKGLATEIACRLIQYGFDKLNLAEIVATVDDENLVSHRVLEKSGMNFKEYDYDEDGRFSVYSIKSQYTKR